MFFRVKSSGPYRYLQLVENHREGYRTVQRVLFTLGRMDELTAAGSTDTLLRSLARFGQRVRLMEGGDLEKGPSQQLGPDLVFGRLWQTTGVQQALNHVLGDRSFEFPVERAVYLTVLHRLFVSGSDRAAERWMRDVVVPGAEGLALHHLYRAMRWLGEAKDQVEEVLFAGRRDLFTELSLTFFDTTGLYFEGAGGESLGQYGHSKDHRPDLHQMVMGVVLTGDGRPVCCEMWPGNQTDAQSLLPVVDRLRQRFGLRRVCWVADGGMISRNTIGALEDRNLEYILGARMRRQREVSEAVLGRAGRYHEVADNLRVEKDAVCLDPKKVAVEARYDGKFVLRTNTSLPAGEVAVQYKRLLLVEQFFRAAKSLLRTRPIFPQWDATIRGHVFCSFLAMVLVDELQRRLASQGQGQELEWDVIKQDLQSLDQAPVRQGSGWYLLRSPLQGVTGKVLQAAGVAIPPPVRPV